MKFINSSYFKELLGSSKVVILDGGARGDLFSPFNQVNPNVLTVVKIEPDSNAEVGVNGNEIIFNKAIWRAKETIKIHLAEDPSVSSVFPPNIELVSRFHDEVGEPARRTKKVITVQGQDIDSIFKEINLPFPDFIKLDIHGCEAEALEGATESLKDKAIGLLIEAWVIETHINQKLTFHIDKLLHENAFYPFETSSGKWPFKNADNLHSKSQSVVSESLYLKDILHRDGVIEMEQAVKLIAISDLFGFSGYSILLTEYLRDKKIIEKETAEKIKAFILTNNKKSRLSKLVEKIKNKLIRLLQNEI